jgi:2-haloacid dehalogenase
MSSLEDVLRSVKTITFDCYGTLIDWQGGLARFFHELLGPAAAARTNELFGTYVQVEAEIEGQPYHRYRDVLAEVATRFAERLKVDLAPGRVGLLADMLPDWAPFPDTNDALVRLKNHYRLGVLSNIDRDLFAGTARHFDVPFDFVVTAQDVRSYKPGHAHFERLLVAHSPRGEVLHVAQSLFHDGAPAGELGIPYVWINRYGEKNETDVRPLAVFKDLVGLADAADQAAGASSVNRHPGIEGEDA